MRKSVVVIGAGQAGLSAGYHLQRLGLGDFVVLDAEDRAGGAWQHRWESLRMATVNGIFDLPGFPKPPLDPEEPSRTAVPRYFADFERVMNLPIERPVRVEKVRYAGDDLAVQTDRGEIVTRAVVNATGTWTNPVRPSYPGHDSFLGRHLHTGDYVSADELAGRRVAVVGGGISAVQFLDELAPLATTHWYTRREPFFRDDDFEPEVAGREVIARVTADAEAGRPPRSIVSYTGLPRTARRFARRPMFTVIEPYGVREADGSFTSADVILWATGFRAALSHLDPLHLRNAGGGIRVIGTQVAAEPRVHLIGFGPSQSTVGANRAGREAARKLVTFLSRPS